MKCLSLWHFSSGVSRRNIYIYVSSNLIFITRQSLFFYWADCYRAAFGNSRVSFCVAVTPVVVAIAPSSTHCTSVYSSSHIWNHIVTFVQFWALASLWCSFQHPRISPCYMSRTDSWCMALRFTFTTCTPHLSAGSLTGSLLTLAKGRVQQEKTRAGAFWNIFGKV